jgi:hypothetical protein
MIELGLRCAGDLIPYVVKLATGIDLSIVGARIAANEVPCLQPSRQTAAAIRFLYPPYDARVQALAVRPAASALPWLQQVAFTAHPGSEFYLPPRGFLSRLGFVIVTGSSVNECQERMEQAQAVIDIDLEPLPTSISSGPRVAPRR